MNLINFLFPPFCISCKKRFGKYICGSCRKLLQPVGEDMMCPVCERASYHGYTHQACRTKYEIDGLISFFRYRSVVQKAIKQVKYQFVSDITHELVKLCDTNGISVATYPWLDHCVFTPVPLHSSRFRFRGFNQSELFAYELANRYHRPFVRDMIRRNRSTVPQVEMPNKKQRQHNMKGMFSLYADKPLPPTVIIVDDVYTTGATMREAGRLLKQYGVQTVWGMTIAR